MAVIGIDCGGTTLRAGRFSDPAPRPETVVDMPTPRRVEELAPAMADLGGRLGEAAAMGIAIAGMVDHASGRLVWMPHRGGDAPLGDEVGALTGIPTTVDNDANAAALAEATAGAGVGHRMVLMLTVGTGIGGGLVIDGRVERGRAHLGEMGHILMDPSGPRCACGMVGCWEALASGTALDRTARAVVAADPSGGTAHRSGNDRPTGRHLMAAAADGDGVAIHAVAEVGEWFGRGVAGLILALDPDIVVVGGGVGTSGEDFLGPAREAMARRVVAVGGRPPTPLVTAAFGTGAGLVGAALMAKRLVESIDAG